MFKRAISFAIIFCLVFEQSGFAQVAPQMNIPAYLSGYLSPDRFRPVHIRSLSFDQATNNFNLILDKGDVKNLRSTQLEETTRKLFEYFQTGLALPNSMFWVNLRPDDPTNIIDPYVEKTDLGRVLLEADLQLKKDMAAFTSPDKNEGRAYWNRLYAKAESLFGQQDLSIPTITRPWIVPGEIIMAQSEDKAYIYKATLKVMLEQDYLKDAAGYNFNDPRLKELNDYSTQIIREEILPKLTREVNSAKRYAGLRQVYYSLILAQWFKSKKADSIVKGMGRGIDQKDLTGLTSKEQWSKQSYYQAYKRSFEQGEYNKEETVPSGQGLTIRKYFSGGIETSTEQADIMIIPFNRIIGSTVTPFTVALDTKTGAFTVNAAVQENTPAASGDGGDKDFMYKLNFLASNLSELPSISAMDEGGTFAAGNDYLDKLENVLKETISSRKEYDEFMTRLHDEMSNQGLLSSLFHPGYKSKLYRVYNILGTLGTRNKLQFKQDAPSQLEQGSVRLNNGFSARESLVQEVWNKLKNVYEKKLLMADALAMAARFPGIFSLTSQEKEFWKEKGLLQKDGSLDPVIRNIVVSSFDGNGAFNLKVLNPRLSDSGKTSSNEMNRDGILKKDSARDGGSITAGARDKEGFNLKYSFPENVDWANLPVTWAAKTSVSNFWPVILGISSIAASAAAVALGLPAIISIVIFGILAVPAVYLYTKNIDTIRKINISDYAQALEIRKAHKKIISFQRNWVNEKKNHAFADKADEENRGWKIMRVEYQLDQNLKGTLKGTIEGAGSIFGGFYGRFSGTMAGDIAPQLYDESTFFVLVKGDKTLRVVCPSLNSIKKSLEKIQIEFTNEYPYSSYSWMAADEMLNPQYESISSFLKSDIFNPSRVQDELSLMIAGTPDIQSRPDITISGVPVKDGIIIGTGISYGDKSYQLFPKDVIDQFGESLIGATALKIESGQGSAGVLSGGKQRFLKDGGAVRGHKELLTIERKRELLGKFFVANSWGGTVDGISSAIPWEERIEKVRALARESFNSDAELNEFKDFVHDSARKRKVVAMLGWAGATAGGLIAFSLGLEALALYRQITIFAFFSDIIALWLIWGYIKFVIPSDIVALDYMFTNEDISSDVRPIVRQFLNKWLDTDIRAVVTYTSMNTQGQEEKRFAVIQEDSETLLTKDISYRDRNYIDFVSAFTRARIPKTGMAAPVPLILHSDLDAEQRFEKVVSSMFAVPANVLNWEVLARTPEEEKAITERINDTIKNLEISAAGQASRDGGIFNYMTLDEKFIAINNLKPIARGLESLGAVHGYVIVVEHDKDPAVYKPLIERLKMGKNPAAYSQQKGSFLPIILYIQESNQDYETIIALSDGVIQANGLMTSDVYKFASSLGLPVVTDVKQIMLKGLPLQTGDWLTLDANSGNIYEFPSDPQKVIPLIPQQLVDKNIAPMTTNPSFLPKLGRSMLRMTNIIKEQPKQEPIVFKEEFRVPIPNDLKEKKVMLFSLQLDSIPERVRGNFLKRFEAINNQEVAIAGRDGKISALYVVYNNKEFLIDWTMKGTYKLTDPETKKEYVSGAAKDGGISFKDYPSLRIDQILAWFDERLGRANKSEEAEITMNAANAIFDIGPEAYPVLKMRLEYGSIKEKHKVIAQEALKELQSHYDLGNNGAVKSAAKDGGMVGGIDLRALPISQQPATAAISMVVPGTDSVQRTVEELDTAWTDIEKRIQSGPMPYEQLKAQAIACCQNKDAAAAREKLSSCIAGLLKLEEEAAVPTAPELKEILIVLS